MKLTSWCSQNPKLAGTHLQCSFLVPGWYTMNTCAKSSPLAFISLFTLQPCSAYCYTLLKLGQTYVVLSCCGRCDPWAYNFPQTSASASWIRLHSDPDQAQTRTRSWTRRGSRHQPGFGCTIWTLIQAWTWTQSQTGFWPRKWKVYK